jgi:hypothetical protein
METEWKMFADVDKEKEYFAVASCLTLNNFRGTPSFMKIGELYNNSLQTPKVFWAI